MRILNIEKKKRRLEGSADEELPEAGQCTEENLGKRAKQPTKTTSPTPPDSIRGGGPKEIRGEELPGGEGKGKAIARVKKSSREKEGKGRIVRHGGHSMLRNDSCVEMSITLEGSTGRNKRND